MKLLIVKDAYYLLKENQVTYKVKTFFKTKQWGSAKVPAFVVLANPKTGNEICVKISTFFKEMER